MPRRCPPRVVAHLTPDRNKVSPTIDSRTLITFGNSVKPNTTALMISERVVEES